MKKNWDFLPCCKKIENISGSDSKEIPQNSVVTQPGVAVEPHSQPFLFPKKQIEADDPEIENINITGRVNFEIFYLIERSTLIFKIIQAKNLEAKDFGGTSDPYVRVILHPDSTTQLTTKTKHKTLNPKWKETFEFQDFPLEKLLKMSLLVQVLDYDRFSKDDLIGELLIPLSNFDLLNGQTLWKNIRPTTDQRGRPGNILIDLCYDPPHIKLGVLKARNLRAKDINGTSDPYVKIYLMYKSERQEKKKTNILENTLNPSFNEFFNFEIPFEKLRHVGFKVLVMDHDNFGRNEMIGFVMLSSKSSPEEVKHWNEMFHFPRKNVSMWHQLRV